MIDIFTNGTADLGIVTVRLQSQTASSTGVSHFDTFAAN